jgi:DNA-binding IclR family transcriptional regulator
MPSPSAVAVLEKTRSLSDASFRVLAMLEALVPENQVECLLQVADIGDLLPANYSGVHRCLAELEFAGWIVRRRTDHHICVDLLYRQSSLTSL